MSVSTSSHGVKPGRDPYPGGVLPFTDQDAAEDLLEQDIEDAHAAYVREKEEREKRRNGGEWVQRLDPCEGADLFYEEAPPEVSVGSVTPSQFTEFALRMPRFDGQGYAPFTFEGRRHMRRIYDTPAQRILLTCGRQVEKSTLLGNLALSYACMIPGYKTLYVSPSATQTKTFSVDRLKEPLETSEVLKGFTTSLLQQNVFEKQFVNRSKIVLRYAFLNADRIRGIASFRILIDELQDILADNIPVIEQSASHAPEHLKSYIYAGTPKGLDNTLEYYRSGTSKTGQPMSTMGEWVVPCDRHGGETGRYWNILSEKNIQKKGLCCEKCHQLIDPMHLDAQWAMMQENGVFENYRVPQLMVPWRSWKEILLDYGRYDRARFYNEVLGTSYDSGLRPLTRQQMRDVCTGADMSPRSLAKFKALSAAQPVFAGIDWGTGENSYTVLVLATYIDSKFTVFYAHRFTGEDTDPEPQLKKISQMLQYFNVRLIGTDYGGGFHPNDKLTRLFGPQRVWKYMWMPRGKKKLEWKANFRRFHAVRTEVLSDVFNAIKRKQIAFPSWTSFEDPHGHDFLNVYAKYNNQLRMLQYDHRPDRPDDTMHATTYALLVSMLVFPRPDIIAPNREIANQGPLRTGNTGPTNQY